MDNPLVLIVEDEPEIAEILAAYFDREGFRVVVARDGDLAVSHHRTMSPDIVLLDVRLPKRDGHAVLGAIRREADTPVIMVTALGEDLEKVMALTYGADDYIVKPFNPLEVVARTKAVLRRSRGLTERTGVLRVGALEIDPVSHRVGVTIADGSSVFLDLTATEFRIVCHMARTPTKVFSRSEIVDACLPADGDALERTVDSHISKLRKKLASAGQSNYFAGVRGVGYRLCD
jgi:two-component system response regulator AdeR